MLNMLLVLEENGKHDVLQNYLENLQIVVKDEHE
jgi:hypothetical protein